MPFPDLAITLGSLTARRHPHELLVSPSDLIAALMAGHAGNTRPDQPLAR